ncbi:hypothetical protein [Pontiella sulfatireligans]|uniref:Uncharacterized protein n=1 Tax=Pontiella sulfatireligans TaxID=2750658 RepID=A0A6C2USN5_9BACT|nr:hypothetical protein [Pontiella sulfatireligans]VGO22963.1 hypothetical protein SCARR_05062 [Pontiella sulfatireligans]
MGKKVALARASTQFEYELTKFINLKGDKRMKAIKMFTTMVLLSLLIVVSGAYAEGEKVLTIYFAGTTMHENSSFDDYGEGYSELLSKLYSDDNSTPVEISSGLVGAGLDWWFKAEIPPESGPKYKAFIDGIGIHYDGDKIESCPNTIWVVNWFKDVGCEALPFQTSRGCRNYDIPKSEAGKAFWEFEQNAGSGDLIVNLIGFSRGGISAMQLAGVLKRYPRPVKINILAIDPVPGVNTGNGVDGLVSKGFDLDFSVSNEVNQYVGLYAEDERTVRFEPMLPQISTEIQRHMLYSLRGSHETLVGNPDADGHPGKGTDEPDDRLRNVYNACRMMAERLLTSPEWGSVSLKSAFGELNPKQAFANYIQEMNNYPASGYYRIQLQTFDDLRYSMYDGFGGEHDHYHERGFEILYDGSLVGFEGHHLYERLMFRWPYHFDEDGYKDIAVFYLNQTTDEFVSYDSANDPGGLRVREGKSKWKIEPADQPVIKSLYGGHYWEKAGAAWDRMELLRGCPVPDVADLSPTNGRCSFALTVPTATDNTAGEIYQLEGIPVVKSGDPILAYGDPVTVIITNPGTYTVTWAYYDIDGNTSTQDQEVIVLNIPPVSDAGTNQAVYAWIDGYAPVLLDGTGSYDDDGNALEYFWYNVADELIATGAVANVQLPVGENAIKLVVNDGYDDSEPDSCAVTVVAALEARASLRPHYLSRRRSRRTLTGRLELTGLGMVQSDLNEPMVLMPGGAVAKRMKLRTSRWFSRSVRLESRFDCTALMGAIEGRGNVECIIAVKLRSGQWVYGTETVSVR